MGLRSEGSDGAGGTAPKNVTPQADGFNFFHCLVFEPHIAESVRIPFVTEALWKNEQMSVVKTNFFVLNMSRIEAMLFVRFGLPSSC